MARELARTKERPAMRIAATILLLCGLSGGGAPAASAIQDAAPSGAAEAVELRPGQWEIVTEMISVDAPTMPAAVQQQMGTQLRSDPRQTQSQCITPEQARFPARSMMGSNPAGCTFRDTRWEGGSFTIAADCRPQDGPVMRMAVTGTYAAERFAGRIVLDMDMPKDGGSGIHRIHIVGNLAGRRTGACQP